jgi:hypothetical protein
MPRVFLESRPRLDVGRLVDAKALALGAVSRLAWPSFAATVTGCEGRIDLVIDGGEVQHIPVVSGPRARRTMFLCPDCSRRAERLFELGGKFACDGCHGLGYRSGPPGYHPSPGWSALQLRRQYGLPDILCGPLPPWQGPTHGWRAWREHKAYDRAVVRIRRYEARLLADLIRFNVDLEKYQGGEP